jgi:hypothetical protein
MSASLARSHESSDKESIVEEQSVNGDEELRAERDSPPVTGYGGGPLLLDSIDAAVGIGGSGMPPYGAIQRVLSFSFNLPLFVSEKTRRQQDTTHQDEEGNTPQLLATMRKTRRWLSTPMFFRDPPLGYHVKLQQVLLLEQSLQFLQCI